MSTPLLRGLSILAVGAMTIACGTSKRGVRPRTDPKVDVTAEDIEKAGGDPIEKQLQAKSPGVIVSSSPGGGITVQIRGPASFYGSSEPLYVIDDVPFSPQPGGVLQGINPHDIEYIKVLKNPEDVGVYGVRGGNGVIYIRMKKPGRQ
ncbi:MAG TPA: TonB-dependent receptor plug domain-containing protein [Gemmatimonadaceae bacterium]|nr:TonB-dependent receptor plug domain-containing protein [Gemmatimonadaceae bacterium]